MGPGASDVLIYSNCIQKDMFQIVLTANDNYKLSALA